MQNINELLSQYKKKQVTIKRGDDSVQGKFNQKIKDIQIKEFELQTAGLAKSQGSSYINLVGFPIAPEILRLVEQGIATKYKVICFFRNDQGIKLGAVDPGQEGVVALSESLSKNLNLPVEIYFITQNSFDSAFRLYASLPIFRKIETGVTITEADLSRFQFELLTFESLQEKITKVNVSDIITLVIASSLKSDSSDIHIEAEESDIKVRFRVDGILLDVAQIKKELWPKVISRIKLLSGLKINITDKPQDGRFTINLTGDKIDVRVSALPTTFGESVVMRLLRSGAISIGFEELGLRGSSFERLKEQVERPQGMIITTGPTGSGKTTTLYGILRKLNNADTKIITLEDPVEYKLQGVNQSQIDRSRGYGFADGLRSILRQDPDVIMVGELRDLETADVAINAALTGHLVVSTLHTNSAAGAIPRFMAMEVKPFLLGPALNAIIGQRLVRRICKFCKTEAEIDEKNLVKVKGLLASISPMSGEAIPDLEKLSFYKGGGCEKCNGLGYKGRVGIYEIFIMNKEIGELVSSGQVAESIVHDSAVKNGMVTMVQDGLLKVIDGLTTVDEVFRVIE